MGSRPGPLCQWRNPVNINDGTLCAAQSPQPGVLGERSSLGTAWDDWVWAGNEALHGIVWAGQEVGAGAVWTWQEVRSGASWSWDEFRRGGVWISAEVRGGAIWIAGKAYDAYQFLIGLIQGIKNAADWKTLNSLVEPILGPQSLQAGVLYGIVESLRKDVLSLLELGKMIVLAGLYELMIHPQVAASLAFNPTMAPMVLTSLALSVAAPKFPWLAAQLKKADDQLRKMMEDLYKVVRHPLDFLSAVGKTIKKEAMDDWNTLKYNAEHPTVAGDFQAGRIIGRVLYQVIMLILLVVSVAGAVAKLAARVPWLLRAARILQTGGKVEELVEAEKIEAGVKAAEDVAEAEKAPKKPSEPSKPSSQPTEEVGPKKPVASALENSEFNGIKADRVRPGTNDKVAVIGRSMDGAVNPYADGLKAQGYDVETFQGDNISQAAQDQWQDLRAKYAPERIPPDVVRNSQLFQENHVWAQKLADQGYTVVDVGNPSGQAASPFYDMEKQVLFGDTPAGAQ
jgi:hypothetical protein